MILETVRLPKNRLPAQEIDKSNACFYTAINRWFQGVPDTMTASSAYLIIRHDPTTQQEFPLPEETVTMGREAYNEIVLYDAEVSREHVEISYQDGRHVVADKGSTNGTFVNGRRINVPTPLNDGDVIEVGEEVSMTFRDPSSDYGDKTTIEPPPVPVLPLSLTFT